MIILIIFTLFIPYISLKDLNNSFLNNVDLILVNNYYLTYSDQEKDFSFDNFILITNNDLKVLKEEFSLKKIIVDYSKEEKLFVRLEYVFYYRTYKINKEIELI